MNLAVVECSEREPRPLKQRLNGCWSLRRTTSGRALLSGNSIGNAELRAQMTSVRTKGIRQVNRQLVCSL